MYTNQNNSTLCCRGFWHTLYNPKYLLSYNCGVCVTLQLSYQHYFKIIVNKKVMLFCCTNGPPYIYRVSKNDCTLCCEICLIGCRFLDVRYLYRLNELYDSVWAIALVPSAFFVKNVLKIYKIYIYNICNFIFVCFTKTKMFHILFLH